MTANSRTVQPDGPKVAQLRMHAGMSQEKLAAAAGCSKRTIENVEAGRPTLPDTLAGIAEALGVTCGSLIQGSGDNREVRGASLAVGASLAFTMEVAGDLIPGRRGGSGLNYASGRLYQFTLTNVSSDCTVVVKDIQLAVLATVRDEHCVAEATTANNDYEVMIGPGDAGRLLELLPLNGAPRVRWGYHFAPRSAPDRFSVHVIPTTLGHSYAIRFIVSWYDPATKQEFATKSNVFAAFFPEAPKGQSPAHLLFLGGSQANDFRKRQREKWRQELGETVLEEVADFVRILDPPVFDK